jgi:hypothetical protein
MMLTIPLASDARERFLLEIAAAVPAERIAEVHFFPPMRQGPIETGVAVIAVLPEGATPEPLVAPEAAELPSGAEVSEATLPSEAAAASVVPEDVELVEGAFISSRHVVYSARYRWTRKGPDRGKWESEIIAEADAPLLTVEAVVKGVMARASEAYETERVMGETVRGWIADAQKRWPSTP